MTSRLVVLSFALLLLLGNAGHAQIGRDQESSLTPFRDDREFSGFVRKFELERRQAIERSREAIDAARGCGSAKMVKKIWARKGSSSPAVITGKATAIGTSAQGTSVYVTGQALGAIAGPDGSYSLVLPAQRLGTGVAVRLVARRIGFAPSEASVRVAPGDSIQIDFAICPARGELQSVVVSGVGALSATDASESITNVQHAGVDEGGIVKMHGNHLVILRRGRLFTVSLADGRLRAAAALDAFGPGLDPRAAWYDELLLYGDKAVVIGYSYQRGGTEIGVFRIDNQGRISYLATYQLRSNDYYSSRNYASRLIGSKLVLYTPLGIAAGADPIGQLPSMRKWKTRPDEPFERITPAPRIYKPARPLDPIGRLALHTVTSCDLASEELQCEATALVGPPGRVFYVSRRATYVWVTDRREDRNGVKQAVVYRMPLDGTPPTALGATGSPVDQFSFLESDDDHLNVLVLSGARGETMWRSERAKGDASLLRVAIGSFGAGSRAADRSSYRTLPSDSTGVFHNRFVGDYLLYGTGNGWGRPRTATSTVYVVPWKGGRISPLGIPHRVDRIEPMGRDAVIIGSDSARLHFDGVSLSASPHLAQRFVLNNAAQGELRSHGFFYKPEGAESGVLGLPVRDGGRPGYSHLADGSASILFLRNVDQSFQELGELEAGAPSRDDGCKASCVDWYGNARPLFAAGRVFALLGYELVEGRVGPRAITEVRRVNFAPRSVTAGN